MFLRQRALAGAVGSMQAVWNDQRETEPSVTESYHFSIDTSVEVCCGNQYHSCFGS